MSINIKVKLFATLRIGRDKIVELKLDNNLSVIEVLCLLNIKKEELAFFLLNGIDATYETELKEGDVLALFPPVAGG